MFFLDDDMPQDAGGVSDDMPEQTTEDGEETEE